MMTRDRFNVTRVGDFLDAMAGNKEMENERIKSLAEIVRTSTAILWNIQVSSDNKKEAKELWKFPWDERPPDILQTISEEERKATDDKLEAAILRYGNSNKQP